MNTCSFSTHAMMRLFGTVFGSVVLWSNVVTKLPYSSSGLVLKSRASKRPVRGSGSALEICRARRGSPELRHLFEQSSSRCCGSLPDFNHGPCPTERRSRPCHHLRLEHGLSRACVQWSINGVPGCSPDHDGFCRTPPCRFHPCVALAQYLDCRLPSAFSMISVLR